VLCNSIRLKPENGLDLGITICKASDDAVSRKKDSSLLRRILMKIVYYVASAVLVLALFLAALPTIISTSLGLGAATMAMNIAMPGMIIHIRS